MTTFCSLDQKPVIHAIGAMSEKISGKSAQVHVGLSIQDFTEFNTVENKFVFSGIIWFEFEPNSISLENIDNFSFEHAEIEHKSKPFTYRVGDKLLVRYTIRVRFRSDLSYQYFPFEDHKIHIILINDTVSIGEMVYNSTSNDFRLSKEANTLTEWDYHDHCVSVGYSSTTIGSASHEKTVHHPVVDFEIDYIRISVRYITIVILPLLLIFFIELFSLCVDQQEHRGTLIGLSATNIAALLAYKFVLETISPRVGYLMLSDYFFFLFLGVSFFMFFVSGVGPYLTRFQKKLVSIGLQAFVVLVFVYITNFVIVC